MIAIACRSTDCGKQIAEREDDGTIVLRRRAEDHGAVQIRIWGTVELQCHREVFLRGRWQVCRTLNRINGMGIFTRLPAVPLDKDEEV